MIPTFLQNKYSRIYDAIINKRQHQSVVGYSEKHHIVPRSLGGTNDLQNIVRLTAREHFVCHKLLIRMLPQGSLERQKMALALHKMAHGTNAPKYQITSHEYESIRKLNANAVSYMQLQRFEDPEVYQKQVEYALNASQIAAERNRGNPEFSASCSKRTQRHLKAGTHNFLGGKVQKASWQNPACREKHHQNMIAQISTGTHLFQQPEFIENQRQKLKKHWANMTPEKRVERGRKISESKRKTKGVV